MSNTSAQIMNCIFDLDGTLANAEHRLHLIHSGTKNYDEFNKACPGDTPIEPVIKVMQALRSAGHRIHIITGRSDLVFDQTQAWLSRQRIQCDSMYMRVAGDHRNDDVIKEEIFKTKFSADLRSTQLFCAFEDRQRVVNMWRRNGVMCFQVAEGNF